MLSAIEAIKSGQLVFHATLIHRVPKSTLYDRISGTKIHGKKPGPDPYLTSTEEKGVFDRSLNMENLGVT